MENEKKCKYKLIIVSVTYKSNIMELKEFINSFFMFNDLGNEAKLIIVDNSPADYRDVELLINQYEDVSYVPSPENPGFGAANNKGFDLYESEYALFINNDVEFTEPLFQNLIRIHESDERIGCIGIHQTGGAPSFFPKMTAPKEISNDIFQDDYHFISGAFMFFKSSAFEQCGKFDPQLFMYFEEFDISTRLKKNGYLTIYVDNLSFWHKVKNRRVINETTWKNAIPSFSYICRKYNLDPQLYSKSIMRRLRLLFIYQFCLFHFKEAAKIWRVYKYRQKIIYQEFGVRI